MGQFCFPFLQPVLCKGVPCTLHNADFKPDSKCARQRCCFGVSQKAGTMLKYRSVFQCLRGAKQFGLCPLRVKSVRFTATVSASKEAHFSDAALASAKPFEEIPHFTILPVIGTTWLYMPIVGPYDLRKKYIAAMDKRRILGNVFREKAGPLDLVVSFNANDGEVLFRNEGPYPSRGAFTTLKTYREFRKQWYSSTGLLILQGKEWHDLRIKVQKHLMKPKAIQAYLNPMQDVARDMVDKIYKTRDAKKEVPEFLEELYKWALESVAFIGLDTRLGCLMPNLSPDSDGMRMISAVQTQFDCMNALEAVMGNIPIWQYFPTPTWKKFEKACDVFTQIALQHINRSLEELKKSANEDKDLTLLQSMLLTKGLDISGAMVTVADMLTAGIDTTSHSVGFFLYNMARNPEKQELLYKELMSLLPQKEHRITSAVFNELKYLKVCIKESQRLHPIVGRMARTLDHDIIFSGYRVPAGTILVLGLQEIYRDERYFSNPDQYMPERWLSKDDKFHPFAYLPFGVGVRSCIGRRLAELEIISLLTEIIRKFRVEYHYEDIGITTGLINTPDKPLRFTFTER